MKISLLAVGLLLSLNTFAQMYMDDPARRAEREARDRARQGEQNGPGYLVPGDNPYQPQLPPPPQNGGYYGPTAICRIEYTGNYYYVSKNGQRFGELTADLRKALEQQNSLERSGACVTNYQAAGSCQLEYTGNYFYISRNGTRMSELTLNYQNALATRDMLYQNRNCDENTYRTAAVCGIQYTGNYYYVSRNGNRISELVLNLDKALNTRNDFLRGYVCRENVIQDACRLEYTGNYYYVSVRNQRSSELVLDLNKALNQQRYMADQRLCQFQMPERCTLEYTGNYYYVARNGQRITSLTALNQAQASFQQLQMSRNCY